MTEPSSSQVVADSLLPASSLPASQEQQATASTSASTSDEKQIESAAGPSSTAAKQSTIALPTQQDAERLGFNIFSHLLDSRLLRALADQGFGIPTPIQQKAIPLALSGKDILARAPTGSGKTLAYALPILQKILHTKSTLSPSDPKYQQTRALILVPTRELSQQVFNHLSAVIEYAREEIKLANVARDSSDKVHKLLLSEKPDVVIATPSKALNYLQNSSLSLKTSLESMAIDEADLILSYGHDQDVRSLLSGNFLPTHFQTFLMSATMTSDVNKLKGLLLRNPVILKLNPEDHAASSSNLIQFYTKTSEEDKFLLVYVILKLKLIRGKAILFVNDVERGYRLKLFLEKFGLRACVLNAELPINSRYSIVEEFNKGKFDYIVATDEPTGLANNEEEDVEDEDEVAEADQDEDDAPPVADAKTKKRKVAEIPKADSAEEQGQQKKKKKRSGASTNEFGVSRGVDFVNVSCVINFDLPTSVTGYVHRVGRTARGGASGTSLSFVVPSSMYGKSKNLTCSTTMDDERVFKKIVKSQKKRNVDGEGSGGIQEWNYDRTSIEGFRYRVTDVLKSITKLTIRESRIKELKNEILTSTKLQSHFEDHPDDLNFLKHDKSLLNARSQQQHLKHIPQYLIPKIVGANGERLDSSKNNARKPYLGYIAKNKSNDGNNSTNKKKAGFNNKKTRSSSSSSSSSKKKFDPLKKFAKK